MSPSAEPVQDTADLDTQVEVMLRDAGEAAEDGVVMRQNAKARSGKGEQPPVDGAVEEAVEDASVRRAPETGTAVGGGLGDQAFEDAASVLGELDDLGRGDAAGGVDVEAGAVEDELGEVDSASIEDLDAALAERAATVAISAVVERERAEVFDEAGDEEHAGAVGASPESVTESPARAGEPGVHRQVSAPPMPAIKAAVSVAAAASPAAQELSEGAAVVVEKRSLLAWLWGTVIAPVAERMLGGVSARLERLSPGARQTISWAGYITALNAAAVWTVVLLRSSGPDLPPVSHSAPAAAEHAPKASAKSGGGSHAPAKKSASKSSSKSSWKSGSKSGSKKEAKGSGH